MMLGIDQIMRAIGPNRENVSSPLHIYESSDEQ
jgi:hypothetical protein